MEASKLVITRNKIDLQDILVPNINFVIQCVFEKNLVLHREYITLTSISDPYKAATALVDMMIGKGETTSKSFLRLLQNAKLTAVFPRLKTRQHVALESLRDNRDKWKSVDEKYNDVVQHNKRQVVATEKYIRAEFEMMHQFLREEEKRRLAALKEEEEQKGERVSKEMKIIQDQISSRSDRISALEQELLQEPSETFLSGYKHAKTSAGVECKLPEPQLVSGALIDRAKHLDNLTFKVWEKMKERVKFTPVILDPNTASPSLCLSEDLTSVRRGDTKQKLPDNPERNTKSSRVLGLQGFSSGKHSWEVDVGDHPEWKIGVVKESVDRKRDVPDSTPTYGFWCLSRRRGKYDNGCKRDTLYLKRPQRIRVQLDYDRGEVSFHDSEDMTHLCTHNATFTEKLYPYFSVRSARGAKTIDIKVCQVETSVSVNMQ